MWAATGDARFKERADYLVQELKDSSRQARGRLPGRPGKWQGTIRGSRPGEYPLRRFRPERAVVAVVCAPQDLRRLAGCVSFHRQCHGPGSGNQVRRLGPGNSLSARRPTDPADAEYRVRRHERDFRGPVRRHGRQTVARSVVQVRTPRIHRSAPAAPGQPRPANTATPKSPK